VNHNINYGVQQFGGTSQVGVQAVGTGAMAVAGKVDVGRPETDLAALLATVRRLVDEHADALPDTAATTAQTLGEELASKKPSRGTVLQLVDRLAKLVAPVEPVANAVGDLAKAAQSVFGG
jgi:hypothetical protein